MPSLIYKGIAAYTFNEYLDGTINSASFSIEFVEMWEDTNLSDNDILNI